MPELFMDVDTALAEIPVNLLPLIDDTDFKTRETGITYDQAGMDLVWNFVTTAGAMTQTAVTPTTAGDYDWAHQGDGIYSIEIPASGGASINNDTEGHGWFSGFCTGVLPWRGPVICFRASAINNALIDGGDNLDVNTVQWLGTACATPTVAGVPEVDLTHMAGGTQTVTDLKDFADAGYDPATNKVQGVVLTDTITTYTGNTPQTADHAAAISTAQDDLDIITGADGVTLATAQALYAPNKVVPDVAGTAATPAEVATALTDIHLDHLLATDYDPASKPGVATALLNELIESDGGVSRYTANALEQAPSGTGGDATEAKQDTIITHLTDVKGGTFSGATDSLEAIRDRGDSAWTTGAGGSDRLLMVDTTIATLASQTSFTLAGGSTDDNAYRNCTVVVEDASTAAQKAIGICSAYTGATKTVTLKYDPDVFTMATSDKVYILAENALKSTDANRQLDVTATGAAGIDWGNVENKTTANDLSATDIQLCDTTTTNTDMITAAPTAEAIVNEWETQSQTDPTGFHVNVLEIAGTGQTANDNGADINAILTDTDELQTDWANNGRLDVILDARSSQSSVDTIDGNVDSILVDTAEIGAAGAGLTNINLPNQTMDIVGDITGNLSGSVGSLTGHTNQTADHTAGIADIPTVAEFNARTLASADYVVVGDTIAGVTLVDTVTTNTDLVTAAAIKAAMEASGSDLDYLVKALVNKLIITEATGNTEMFNDSSSTLGSVTAAFTSDGTYTTRKRMVI